MIAEGPYFDELHLGQVYPAPSNVTLTDGLAATHQSIVGNRFALALDQPLAQLVGGSDRLASPSLVWDVCIGQSTVVTQQVKANLFYRGLAFHRFPAIGDTLRTTTTVAGLRQNRAREGRATTGLAALRITTSDQNDAPVLDFWRCAMLPLRNPSGKTGHADDLASVGAGAPVSDPTAVATWDLGPVKDRDGWYRAADLTSGQTIDIVGGDVVSSAPELARLTLNVARVHHDAEAAGERRLVYGGHAIGLATSQAVRALPGLLAISGWNSCDHTGPVHEGDLLTSTIEIGEITIHGDCGLVQLRSMVTADGERPVLDWRYTAIFAP